MRVKVWRWVLRVVAVELLSVHGLLRTVRVWFCFGGERGGDGEFKLPLSSYFATALSWPLRSLAHLANSSCELVAVISFRRRTTSARRVLESWTAERVRVGRVL